jgi:uncharacterized spore protein YtfJ
VDLDSKMEVQPMVTELETAMAEARRAGDGGPIEGFVERIADRIGAHATVKAVFGDPIERDGITIIPVAKVRWGFGGGAGSGPVPVGPGRPGADSPFGEGGAAATEESRGAGSSGFGSGGGGGVTAEAIGWLEIGPDGADFRPIVPAMPSPGFLLAAGATAALVLRGLARLLRR